MHILRQWHHSATLKWYWLGVSYCKFINPLLTEQEGRTGEHWPKVVVVQKQLRANIPQYGLSKLALTE